MGTSPERLHAIGYGSEVPLVPYTQLDAPEVNERIELLILKAD